MSLSLSIILDIITDFELSAESGKWWTTVTRRYTVCLSNREVLSSGSDDMFFQAQFREVLRKIYSNCRNSVYSWLRLALELQQNLWIRNDARQEYRSKHSMAEVT
jgi:hypothetical protein